jgi:glycosyltransferase involved in cell wall biosynthesis
MRSCFVVHGLPPAERGGVEQCTVALCDELAARGHVIEVFAPRVDATLPDRSLRRERRGRWHATFVNALGTAKDPEEALAPEGMRAAFARFLDAERPEVVHVQHLLRLGVELLHEPRLVGAPLVFTAHDWFALSDRFALLAPDLSRYGAAPTADDEARADLAQSLLNRVPELGDYHLGVPLAWLAPQVRERVATTLRGDPVAAGFHPDEWRLALERRERMAAVRRAAFARVDAFVSPSRFLAQWLEDAFRTEDHVPRVVHQPNGVDTRRLAALPRVDTRTGTDAAKGTVRLGFVGGLTKHKGAHLLLEAWARLGDRERERLPLVIHGDSSDRAYVERVRARARELGATCAGAFESTDLVRVFGSIDVLVVPSLWYENFPTVIREAFAAGRPVVASDLGALPESVRDGVDGLLFRPDDADDLARVLRRLINEAGLVERLAAGAPRVLTIGEQADAVERLHAELVAERPRARLPGGDLAHLADLGARWLELEALPTRELFTRALTGLAALGREFGFEHVDSAELVARGVGESSRALDELRDRRDETGYLARLTEEREKRAQWLDERLTGADQERTWLRSEREDLHRSLRFHEESTHAVEKERDWLRRLQQDLEKERDWLTKTTGDLEKERDWLTKTTGDLEKERDWLAQTTEELGREREWLASNLSETRTAFEREREWRDAMLREIERERDWLRTETTSRDEERKWLRQLVSEKEETLTYVWRLVEGKDSDLVRLRGEIEECERIAKHLLETFGRASPAVEESVTGGKLETMLGGLVEHGHALLAQLESLSTAQARAQDELGWRRSEMDRARAALERRAMFVVQRFTGLGRIVRTWQLPGGGA